ncbi:MAG: class I SAM-dependent methyltransferase [Acidobacteriota bacterium]
MAAGRGAGEPLFSRAWWFIRSRPTILRRIVQRALADLPLGINRRRVEKHWGPAGSAALAPRVWTNSRVIREYLHRRVSGDPRCDWVTWMLHRHAPNRPGLRVLVLGCGDGWLERVLARDARIAFVTGVDVSPEIIEEAERRSSAEGLSERISHAVADLDRDPLPAGTWDLVLSHDVIHHVRNLEGLYARTAAALAPDGALLFCEYVGPRRFDYGRAREIILDDALRSLPQKYRRLPDGRGFATRGHRTDPGELALRDPSEAVRSDDILPVLRASMDVLEEIPYGGSLLSPLLYELVANFDEERPEDEALLRGLCERESALMAEGRLPSDYVVAAARARAVEQGPGSLAR